MNKHFLKHIAAVFVVSVFLSSCAKQNASFLKQGYHDLTSHYNAYFNANETFNIAIKSIEGSRKENYSEILPLYAYGTPEDTKKQDAQFTKVIDKSSESIQLHQISNWSDDNFLLLGKAFFMKGDYHKAITSLRYITANYKDGVDGRSEKQIKKDKRNKKLKARKKKIAKKNLQKLKDGKDIRPKKNLFVHQAAKSEALIWMIKAFTANEQYAEASAVLDYIKSDNTFIQNYDRETDFAYANYFLAQNQYSEAIKHLRSGIEKSKNKKKNARYNFVLAQLYNKIGNKAAALTYFLESAKGNADYEMVFNAQLNAIKLSNGNNSEKEEKMLSKLIKDSKNIDYLDQLYYEKGLIALHNKKESKAIELFHKSIEASTTNTLQKAKSHVKIAALQYAKEDFTNAQENYAACLALISTDFEDYTTIAKRANVLTDLVKQLNTISKNDSLLLIAELPKEQMEAQLYQQAVDIIDAEIKAKQNNTIFDKYASNDKVSKDGKWYFYSDNAKKVGFAQFKKTWGNRKLEDNWRRNNKSSSTDLAEDPKTEDEQYEEKVNTLYESLLAEIPDSDSSKTQFSNDIVSAHYQAANIYKYDLVNNEKAIYHYKKIATKYNESKYDTESLFNLYLLHKELNNSTASAKNKALVLSKYPKSKYAKIINDPNFALKTKDKNIAVEDFYEATYKKFLNEDFSTVISRISESKTKFPSNKYEAKFALLEAITIGKQKKYQPYVNSLENVIKTYKNTIEGDKATELLAYLKGDFTKTAPVKIETTIDKNATQIEQETDDIFDPNKGKDKEGFKVKFGKKDILKVGINEEAEKAKKEKESLAPKSKDTNTPLKLKGK